MKKHLGAMVVVACLIGCAQTPPSRITRLSRRNTNVHALALALGEQGVLAARCEDALGALQIALDQRGFSGTR